MLKRKNVSELNHKPKLTRYNVRLHLGNILFMLPAFLLFAFVVLVPFFQGIPYSFTNWRSIISQEREFVGFSNYITLLTNKFFYGGFCQYP